MRAICSLKGARFKQESFVAEVREVYTDLINRYVSDIECRLTVFDPASGRYRRSPRRTLDSEINASKFLETKLRIDENLLLFRLT